MKKIKIKYKKLDITWEKRKQINHERQSTLVTAILGVILQGRFPKYKY